MRTAASMRQGKLLDHGDLCTSFRQVQCGPGPNDAPTNNTDVCGTAFQRDFRVHWHCRVIHWFSWECIHGLTQKITREDSLAPAGQCTKFLHSWGGSNPEPGNVNQPNISFMPSAKFNHFSFKVTRRLISILLRMQFPWMTMVCAFSSGLPNTSLSMVPR